jgi:dUTP pyrophosphatase
MGEITDHINELKSLMELDIIPEETKNEIKEAIAIAESVKSYDSKNTSGKIKINFINKSTNKNPVYAKVGDSGFDLRANESGDLKPLERKLVGTGLYFELPDGFELQIRPRSGLAFKNGITVLNSPGTVDTGYRGEIKVLLVNISNEIFTWEKGERIAQGVIAHRISSDLGDLIEVAEISETERGVGGFGSTGVN